MFEISECGIISLYTKLKLIAINELVKVGFSSVFLVKYHGCSVRKFKSLKLNILILNLNTSKLKSS